METEGESNNYGIGDLNIQFMGSYVGQVCFLDQERLTLYTFSSLIYLISILGSQAKNC